ncbi:MAG: class I SAM-dependent methyltransferase [Patescibacteria group bacterium]
MPNNSKIEIKCILCGSGHYEIIGEKNSYQVVKCGCGLFYINPQPTAEITKEIYNERYFSGGYNFGYQGINYLSRDNEAWFKYIPSQALRKIEKHLKNKGKILDIGCAVGYFLEVAKENGWEIYGVELSEFARNSARNKLGAEIYPTLEESPFPNNHFNAITAFEIIEHMQDPNIFVKKINSLLLPGGILGISTPNLANGKTFKNFTDWNCLTPPEHLFFFDKQTITNILEKNGFKVLEIFYGPINPLNKFPEENLGKIKKIYHQFKPILKPIKRLMYDLPMEWYGQRSGLGEDMIVIAQKV